ncbi:DNA-methyltransferase [Rhizobium leguminosarum]|uniref:DNA-methyltransferase n=1 Tax=Rhizobium leguminosarum TaxID=384 RepID=UPI0003685C1D|nr:site-specific DNA-methyltransferase [Rhizobium leguminosarum]
MVQTIDLIQEFAEITGFAPTLDDSLFATLSTFCRNLVDVDPIGPMERRTRLISLINEKLKLNAKPLNDFYAACVKAGLVFNSPQKDVIANSFNRNDFNVLLDAIPSTLSTSSDVLRKFYRPLNELETLEALRNEVERTVNKRTKTHDPSLTEPLLRSLLGGFAYSYFPERAVHQVFDPISDENDYEPSYWRRLHSHASRLFNRENTLSVLRTSDFAAENYEGLRDRIFAAVAQSYRQLTNHGYLALIVEPERALDGRALWKLCEDVKLFAEKHRPSDLQKSYFQSRKIQEVTSSYIPEIDADQAQFGLAYEGFTYKDTFATYSRPGERHAPTLVILFQRNERDETNLPCPACRSHDVRGNSYPVFGVKSWECQNWICPDRSMADRGKRFSFLSLLMNQAINDVNMIPQKIVRKWSRDVVYDVSLADTLNMLVSFFSLEGDSITLSNSLMTFDNWKGRRPKRFPMKATAVANKTTAHQFFSEPFFSRFLVERPLLQSRQLPNNIGDDRHKIYCGDAFDVLTSFAPESIDGAVTSPPYYNAREYSQWDNIYCYMYDMYNISRAVHRALKPGAYYLYNIFDYFDNENSIALSAMGRKRMILAAYTVNAFEKAGLLLRGNIVWDKGEIEGKRGFNGGNFSPYYQAPFNCWEHILIFRKDGPGKIINFPSVIQQSPVIKMKKGINTHGHTAPFPDAIPRLLLSNLPKNSVVLDPFAGSLTTGRCAEQMDMIGVSIERDQEYCELGLSLRRPKDLFARKSA